MFAVMYGTVPRCDVPPRSNKRISQSLTPRYIWFESIKFIRLNLFFLGPEP